jgi:hypothetical protein
MDRNRCRSNLYASNIRSANGSPNSYLFPNRKNLIVYDCQPSIRRSRYAEKLKLFSHGWEQVGNVGSNGPSPGVGHPFQDHRGGVKPGKLNYK